MCYPEVKIKKLIALEYFLISMGRKTLMRLIAVKEGCKPLER